MHRLRNLIILIFALALVPLSVSAARFGSGDTFNLGGNERVEDNLYTAGGTVTVAGAVTGDVLAAGGTVYVSGAVGKDATVTGGTVTVSGPVGDDLRAAGGTVTLSGPVTGELLAGGGTVTVLGSATARSVTIGGGTITFDGKSNGPLLITGGDVRINGSVQGPVTVKANTVRFGSGAVIAGTIDVSSPQEPVVENGAKLTNQINYHKIEIRRGGDARDAVRRLMAAVWVVRTLTLITAALLIALIWRRRSAAVLADAVASPGRNFVRGFITFIVVPITLVIVAITIIGLLPAIIGGLMYGLAVLLAKVFAGLVFAALLLKWFVKRSTFVLHWYEIVLGVLLLQLLALIPYVGWIISGVFSTIAFGAITYKVAQRMRPQPQEEK